VKTTRNSTFIAMIFAVTFLLSACDQKTATADSSSQTTPGSTKVLEAADLVGYDGKRLRRKVDGIKEANEKHNHELEKTVEAGPDQ
jgi:ABC-type Fe3+-hydroxamate transport system substrate-binding protein